jgi:hypothetical protein
MPLISNQESMKIKLFILLLAAAAIATFSSSCVPLAAGTAVGYVAHKEGYRVHNPISKR